MYIEDYIKSRSKKKSKFKIFVLRALTLSLIFLVTIIAIKKDDNIKKWLSDEVLGRNFSFYKVKTFYSKYFGGILPFDKLLDTTPVFSEKLEYSEISKYNDGISLSVSNNYLVPVQYSGIVIFVGEKENYESTVIIEQIDGIECWYGNITNLNVKMYDYVEKGSILGNSNDDKLYLVYKKDGVNLDYQNFIQN